VAKPIIARWAPQLILTSSLPEKPGIAAQPIPSAVQAAAADPIPPQPTPSPSQPTPSAQTAPQDIAATTAPLSPELAQLLQTMARDLTNVKRGIEQLQTSQEQMTSDNAKAAEQLKASQEQMTRLIAKASEQNLRPKRDQRHGERPIAAPTRKPVPTLPSPQARTQLQAPTPLQPEEQ
jgi:hypothetical protein